MKKITIVAKGGGNTDEYLIKLIIRTTILIGGI